MGVGGKIIPRIRLTSAKDLVEVEAELGNSGPLMTLPVDCLNGDRGDKF